MGKRQIHHPLAAELRALLLEHPNPVRALQAAAYMKVALPFVGLAIPDVRRLAKSALGQHPIENIKEYRAFLQDAFLAARFQEERYAALAVSGDKRCRVYQCAEMLPLYRRLIVAAGWWDLVDDLSCRIGEALLKEPIPVAKTLRAWAAHKDIWLRRAAIICQRKLKDQTDLKLLYDCIEPSLDEDEFFLRKGIGWALRALAYEKPKEVRRYVLAHRARLSPLSQREALKHLGV